MQDTRQCEWVTKTSLKKINDGLRDTQIAIAVTTQVDKFSPNPEGQWVRYKSWAHSAKQTILKRVIVADNSDWLIAKQIFLFGLFEAWIFFPTIDKVKHYCKAWAETTLCLWVRTCGSHYKSTNKHGGRWQDGCPVYNACWCFGSHNSIVAVFIVAGIQPKPLNKKHVTVSA